MSDNCCVESLINFCGKEVVNHCMCLLPPLPDTSIINLTPGRTYVEYVDCGLILICGVYTKSVMQKDGRAISEQVPFQFCIKDARITDLDIKNYVVEYVDVEKIKTQFACQKTNTNNYYKLNEKDIITVRVVYKRTMPISWTEKVELF